MAAVMKLRQLYTKTLYLGNLKTRYYSICPQKIKEFEENGVVCLRQVFDKKWLDLIRHGMERNLREPSIYCDWLTDENGKGLFFNDYFNYVKIPEYKEYVTSSPAAQIAGNLMRSKVM